MNLILSLLTCFGLIFSSSTKTPLLNEENVESIDNNIIEEQENITEYTTNVDEYENNDSFEDAYNLFQNNDYYLKNSYEITIEAFLSNAPYFIDYDYFSFNILTDSYVNVLVESSSNLSYDFQLYKYQETNVNNDKLETILNDISINNDIKGNCEFSSFLTPGTYYIVLIGRKNATEIIDYSLSVSTVKSQEDYEDATIGDLIFNKECYGAVWLSDYLPVDCSTTFNSDRTNSIGGKNITYYGISSGLAVKNYALDKLREISEGKPIKIAEYYIWNPLLKKLLHDSIKQIRSEMTSNLSDIVSIQVEYEEKKSEIETIIKVTLVVVDIAGKFFHLDLPGYWTRLIKFVSLSIVNEIFNMITPSITMGDINYVEYLSLLQGSFDVGVKGYDSNGEIIEYTPEELMSLRPKKVVALPIYYCLGYDKGKFPNNDKYYISFVPTYTISTNKDSLIYPDNNIEFDQDSNYYCRGKIYAIKELDDITNVSNLTLAADVDIVEPSYMQVYLNSTNTMDPLLTGEYKWFKFIVPETKKYYFLCSFNINNIPTELTDNGVPPSGYNVNIDLFYKLVLGYSNDGAFANKQGGYIDKNTSNILGCYFSIELTAGEEIYFRVRFLRYLASPSFTLRITDEPDPSAQHSHSYDYNYVWNNGKNHKSVCECGDYKIQPHAVLSGSSTCIYCGGKADVGFVGFSSDYAIVYTSENGSYILSNGVVVLNPSDLKEYLKNTLYFFKRETNPIN